MFVIFLSTAFAATNPAHDAVLLQLSQRDGFPGCSSLGVLGTSDQVLDALIDVAKHVTAPPAAPMRAAVCVTRLAGHDLVAWDAIQGWIGDPSVPGLALAVVQNLDLLPEDKAVKIAKDAAKRLPSADGFGKYAPAALQASSYLGVQAIAATIPAELPADEQGTVKSYTPLPDYAQPPNH